MSTLQEEDMKAIIGIDTQGNYKPALHLLRNLGIQNAATTLVHAASPVMPFSPIGYIAEAQAAVDYATAVENAGRTALEEAKSFACQNGINCKTRLILGSPADALIREGDHADLVAVATTHHGRWSNSFLGSISRSLVIGSHSSVLIAKNDVDSPKDLTAVLAVDHSEYGFKCVEKFLHMRAIGIKKIHLVTAFDMHESEAELISANLPNIDQKIPFWIKQKLIEKNEALAERLREWGYEADARVIDGPTNDVLREAMQDTQSDLMIVGAQGHGFIERLLIGSVSLHQVVSEPYPVLVVRA
jgi:nucleotide-binding universal stress UspA family protein